MVEARFFLVEIEMFREARGREHNDPFDSGLALEISV
jgi:hypothetical protein